MKTRLTGIILIAVLSSFIIVAFLHMVPFIAAQNTTSEVQRSISNVSTKSNNNLTLTIKDGVILPINCSPNRVGNCFDGENGFLYVWIDNGTATLPHHFGVRDYTLREGYAMVPTLNIPNVPRSISNDIDEFGINLTLTIKDGVILPLNCSYNRIGDCYDDENGIVYAWIDNGTATLPHHFGVRDYTLREGYAMVPLKNNILGE